MESCKEDFNFILLAAHLGTSIGVLLVIILVMYTFTSKVASDIKKNASGLPYVCYDKYKLPNYKNYQFPSIDKVNSEFQDPDYVSMSKSNTFSYVDRPRMFSPITVKSKTFTK